MYIKCCDRNQVAKCVHLNDVDVQVLFNALSVYGLCCDDFHLVSPFEREPEYFKLCEQVENVRRKLFPIL